MDKRFDIDSQIRVGAHMPLWDEKTVKDEPMLFSATPRFAWENGGPITREFLCLFFGITLADEALWMLRDSKVGHYSFDSRVHMLMPGWWPCIPGWHHDDVPRSRSDGQPNYDSPEYRSKHCLALVNGDIAPTEFAVGHASYPEIAPGHGNVYEVWNGIVDEDVRDGTLELIKAESNRLIHFDCDTFHRGTQAIGRGWRWFGRLSYDAGYDQGRPHYNEVRRQVQVYLENPMKGW